jgi:hypothetical protein
MVDSSLDDDDDVKINYFHYIYNNGFQEFCDRCALLHTMFSYFRYSCDFCLFVFLLAAPTGFAAER